MDDYEKGLRYRKAANAVTRGKTKVGWLIGANIVSGDRLLPKIFRHKSIGLAAVVFGLGALDKVDGMLGRKAESLGVPITKEDAELDPAEDKKFTRIIMGATAIRETVGGIYRRDFRRIGFGVMTATFLLFTENRDSRMNKSRDNAVEGADTSAIMINKVKTVTQDGGHVLAVSPAITSPEGMVATAGVYGASVVMGEIGYRAAHRIHQGIVT